MGTDLLTYIIGCRQNDIRDSRVACVHQPASSLLALAAIASNSFKTSSGWLTGHGVCPDSAGQGIMIVYLTDGTSGIKQTSGVRDLQVIFGRHAAYQKRFGSQGKGFALQLSRESHIPFGTLLAPAFFSASRNAG